ncbi:MAG: RDD family protein [Ilumatobacter sp.]|nr:RDD family protein [Ilumatobacter sp.]
MTQSTAAHHHTAGNRPTDGIVTPEAVVLDLETAGFASRLVAALIDLMIVLLGLFVISLIVLLTLGSAGESTVITVMAFVVFCALFGYPIVFETMMRGRTPGKAALRLRAVTVDGAPLTLRETTLRAMGGIVDKLLPPGGITGVLFVLGTPRHQRVGDLIAGTIVIRDPQQYRPAPALWFSPPPGLEPYSDLIDPSAITTEQYTVIRSFLTRVGTLAPNVRVALAADLADRLGRTIRFPRHESVPPEAYLLCVIAKYQRSVGPATVRW